MPDPVLELFVLVLLLSIAGGGLIAMVLLAAGVGKGAIKQPAALISLDDARRKRRAF